MTSTPARPRMAARESSDMGVRTKAPTTGPSTVPAPPTIACNNPWIDTEGPKGDRGIDVCEVLRVERPAERGEEGRDGHGAQLHAERIDAGRLGRVFVLAHGQQRIAELAAGDPPRDP